MYIKELKREDLIDVANLEKEIYPADLCLGVEDFQEDYDKCYEYDRVILGAYLKGKMVGYIFAYKDKDDKDDSPDNWWASNNVYYVSDLAVNNKMAVLPLLLKLQSRVAGYLVKAELRATSKKILEHLHEKYPHMFKSFEMEEMPNYYGNESAWSFKTRLSHPDYQKDGLRMTVIRMINDNDVINLKTIIGGLMTYYSFEEIEKDKQFILRTCYKSNQDFYAQIPDRISFLVCSEVKPYANRNSTINQQMLDKFQAKLLESRPDLRRVEVGDFNIVQAKDAKLSTLHRTYTRWAEGLSWYHYKTLDNVNFNDGSLAYYRRLINKVILKYEKEYDKNVNKVIIADRNGYALCGVTGKRNCVPYINGTAFDIIVRSLRIREETVAKVNDTMHNQTGYYTQYDKFAMLRKLFGKDDFNSFMDRLKVRIDARREYLNEPKEEDVAPTRYDNEFQPYLIVGRDNLQTATHDYMYPIYEIIAHNKYLTKTALMKLLDKDYDALISIKDALNVLGNQNVRRMRTANLRKEISTAVRKGESLSKLMKDISLRADTNFFKNKKMTKATILKLEEFVDKMKRYAPRVSASYMFSCFGSQVRAIIDGTKEGLFEPHEFIARPTEVGKFVKQCIGERGRNALAKNPKALFKSLANIQSVPDIVAGKIPQKNIPKILFEIKQRNIEIPKELYNYEHLYAKIEPKCSPEFLTAGDASVCCMSFGQDKAIDYAMEKGFGIFNIYYKDRVVGNSLIWINDVYNAFVFDNIEIAPNYVHLNEQIKDLYHQMIDYIVDTYEVNFVVQGYSYNDLELFEDKVQRCSIWGDSSDKDVPANYVSDFITIPRDVNLRHFYSDATHCYIIRVAEGFTVERAQEFIKKRNTEHRVAEAKRREELSPSVATTTWGNIMRTAEPLFGGMQQPVLAQAIDF